MRHIPCAHPGIMNEFARALPSICSRALPCKSGKFKLNSNLWKVAHVTLCRTVHY